MRETLIASSALIVALLLIRRVFRGVLSRRVQYALWALALARLLVPVSVLPAADFSVLTAAAPVQQAVAQQVERPYYSRPVGKISPEELSQQNISLSSVPTAEEGSAMILMEPPAPGSDISYRQRGYLVRDAETDSVTLYQRMTVGWGEPLTAVWKLGMAAMGIFFLLSNLAFYMRLRKNRRVFEADALAGGGQRVYLVPQEAIPSPCLFGNAIYLTPAVAEDPVKLRHVLAHESTHARHLDPVWALLRCVCLTVYWFDPLVWAAAHCSKVDCELACDESVLEALGETERIPYGRTLVSLIPVKRVGNPMLSATTMTAGKKQLKDRVKRIAQKPRQVMAAVVAVAILTAITAACTFTGGTASPTPAPSPTQAPLAEGLRALTAEELRWFNEEYFNSGGVLDEYGNSVYSIRNQFANPINLYDRPEDIDLYELFYCDGEILTHEEYTAVFGREEMECPAYKLTAQEINEILTQYTGLTLDTANKGSLTYTYDEATDAYYWMHGDTNYCRELQFTVGTREGDTVKLYHASDFAGSSWYCVTLKDRGGAGQVSGPYGEESGYWFVSNQSCEKPAIPTPLPAWEAAATIDLSSLEPYSAPTVNLERRPESDFPGGYENRLDNWDFDGHRVMAYVGLDGLARMALAWEDGSFDVFLTMDREQYGGMFFFHDLFGLDGFYVDHTAGAGSLPQRDYYYFNESDQLTLLLEANSYSRGDVFQLDLNGDGSDELLAGETIFFQREGNVYRANLKELFQAPGVWDWSEWNIYGKYLYTRGYTETYTEWVRLLYFDGENLLVYKDEKPTTGHLVDGVARNVPAPVTEQAMEYARSVYETQEGQDGMGVLDDWRIESFYGPYTYSHGGATVEGWQFNYEMHTTTPEKIVLAGGRYITEDNWVSPGYPYCDTLFFEVKDGAYHLLDHRMVQEGMYSYYNEGVVLQLMEENGVELSDGSTYAKLWFQNYLGHLTDPAVAGNEMRIQYDDGQGGGGAYLVDSQEGNGPYYLGQMKDNSVVWSRAQAPASLPAGPSAVLASDDWYEMLQFWRDSGLVMYKQENREPEWFEVKYDGDPAQDVFAYRAVPYYWARCWFDEAEWAALTDNMTIPDRGQGHQAVAQAWVEAHEGAMTKLHPGGQHTCAYVKTVDVKAEAVADTPERWFPEDILPYEHFRFSFSTIFVPENDAARSYLMAGNTGAYEGSDPGVPEGAFQYWLIGTMYLKDGSWYCAGVGTG